MATTHEDPVALVQTLVRLLVKAPSEGLLSLEGEEQAIADAHPVLGGFLRLGVAKVVDGVDPSLLRPMLDARAVAELAALEKNLVLLTEGILALQQGHSPRLFYDMVTSHLSPSDRARFDLPAAERFIVSLEPPQREKRPRPRMGKPPRLSRFADLARLDDRSIQRLLRDVHQNQLNLALSGAPPSVRVRVLGNVSHRVAAAIEAGLAAGKPRRDAVDEARRRVVETARRLAQTGEITAAP